MYRSLKIVNCNESDEFDGKVGASCSNDYETNIVISSRNSKKSGESKIIQIKKKI